jgi:hypothetical protein
MNIKTKPNTTLWLCLLLLCAYHPCTFAYTDEAFYTSRVTIQSLLKKQDLAQQKTADEKIAFFSEQLIDTPYGKGTGEGDWQPRSWIYRAGASHPDANPVYRTDMFDCQSFVQTILALLNAHSIDEFDKQYLRIAYGAAQQYNGEIVSIYNRNHFIETDFNPVNEQYRLISSAHTTLKKNTKYLSVLITKNAWFHARNLFSSSVNFPDKKITIAYIPKAAFVKAQPNGDYIANQAMLDRIPTPAIVEMISDPRATPFVNKTMKAATGSELAVSHMGLLYRKTFSQGEVIYQKISCDSAMPAGKVTCDVTPMRCHHKTCTELMLAHATQAYPMDYIWKKIDKTHYACIPSATQNATTRYHTCNRVVTMPLFAYLTDYQYHSYWYMDYPVFLGVHIEKVKVSVPSSAGRTFSRGGALLNKSEMLCEALGVTEPRP